MSSVKHGIRAVLSRTKSWPLSALIQPYDLFDFTSPSAYKSFFPSIGLFSPMALRFNSYWLAVYCHHFENSIQFQFYARTEVALKITYNSYMCLPTELVGTGHFTRSTHAYRIDKTEVKYINYIFSIHRFKPRVKQLINLKAMTQLK